MVVQSQEVLSRLDTLAAKLGVAANHLWGVLVRQAYVEALGNFLFFVIVLAAVWGAVRLGRYGKAHEWYDGDADLTYIGSSVVALALAACCIAALVGLVQGIQYLVNPEYFALQQVLGALK